MSDILMKAKQAFMKAVSFPGADKEMPTRDTSGKCEGECRNRVREGEVERQHDINLSSVEEIDTYPEAKWAFSRTEPPGVWDGHV